MNKYLHSKERFIKTERTILFLLLCVFLVFKTYVTNITCIDLKKRYKKLQFYIAVCTTACIFVDILCIIFHFLFSNKSDVCQKNRTALFFSANWLVTGSTNDNVFFYHDLANSFRVFSHGRITQQVRAFIEPSNFYES